MKSNNNKKFRTKRNNKPIQINKTKKKNKNNKNNRTKRNNKGRKRRTTKKNVRVMRGGNTMMQWMNRKFRGVQSAQNMSDILTPSATSEIELMKMHSMYYIKDFFKPSQDIPSKGNLIIMFREINDIITFKFAIVVDISDASFKSNNIGEKNITILPISIYPLEKISILNQLKLTKKKY